MITNITPVLLGRGIDTVIPFVIGVVGLAYYSWRMAKDVRSGKRSVSEAKLRLRKVKIVCWLVILFGILKVSDFFG